jgi:gluconolactonase
MEAKGGLERRPEGPDYGPEPMLTTLAAGQSNVEGPCLGPGGWVLNVCSLDRPEHPEWPTRGGDIVATHPDRPLVSTVLANTGGIPVALAFGPDGALFVTDEGRRAIVRFDPAGELADVLTHWPRPDHPAAVRLNGPNDLAFDADGRLYFSDPWTSSPRHPVGGVYGHDPERGVLHQIDTGMWFPNGVVVFGGTLLVAETFRRAIWAYDLRGDGRADNRRLFAELPDVPDAPRPSPAEQERLGVDHICGPDGMALDTDGNLYVAHFGSGAVHVLDERGRPVEQLSVPGRCPTNVCFSGLGLDRLVVTLDDTGEVVVLDGVGTGQRLPFCPAAVGDHPFAARLPAG